MTHDDLAADLAAYMRGMSKRITWLDMQLGESGSPRPDVYTMEPTYTRLTFEAFEVKVSKADFRADVTAGKWQAYLRYANSVTFAAPVGILTKADVPSTCGLVLRGENGQWRYAKRPVHGVLTELPWKAWVKLLLDGVQRAQITGRSYHFNEYIAQAAIAKKFGQEVAELVKDIKALPGRAAYQRQLYEEEVERSGKLRSEEQARNNAAREDAREKCSGALLDLAIRLGLPEDQRGVRDLEGQARRILRLIEEPERRWQAPPLVDLAERMEKLAGDLRSVGTALSPQPKTTS